MRGMSSRINVRKSSRIAALFAVCVLIVALGAVVSLTLVERQQPPPPTPPTLSDAKVSLGLPSHSSPSLRQAQSTDPHDENPVTAECRRRAELLPPGDPDALERLKKWCWDEGMRLNRGEATSVVDSGVMEVSFAEAQKWWPFRPLLRRPSGGGLSEQVFITAQGERAVDATETAASVDIAYSDVSVSSGSYANSIEEGAIWVHTNHSSKPDAIGPPEMSSRPVVVGGRRVELTEIHPEAPSAPGFVRGEMDLRVILWRKKLADDSYLTWMVVGGRHRYTEMQLMNFVAALN